MTNEKYSNEANSKAERLLETANKIMTDLNKRKVDYKFKGIYSLENPADYYVEEIDNNSKIIFDISNEMKPTIPVALSLERVCFKVNFGELFPDLELSKYLEEHGETNDCLFRFMVMPESIAVDVEEDGSVDTGYVMSDVDNQAIYTYLKRFSDNVRSAVYPHSYYMWANGESQ